MHATSPETTVLAETLHTPSGTYWTSAMSHEMGGEHSNESKEQPLPDESSSASAPDASLDPDEVDCAAPQLNDMASMA